MTEHLPSGTEQQEQQGSRPPSRCRSSSRPAGCGSGGSSPPIPITSATCPTSASSRSSPRPATRPSRQIDCVSYSPTRDRIEATVQVKLPFGYSGGLCAQGLLRTPAVLRRLRVGLGGRGPAAINVHDIPVDQGLRGARTLPLSYVAGVNYTPRRNWCFRPVLPRVRAILSWELPPAAGPARLDADLGRRPRVQRADRAAPFRVPRRDRPGPQGAARATAAVRARRAAAPRARTRARSRPSRSPSWPRTYRKAQIPPHRFAFPALAAVSEGSAADVPTLTASALLAKEAGGRPGRGPEVPRGRLGQHRLRGAGVPRPRRGAAVPRRDVPRSSGRAGTRAAVQRGQHRVRRVLGRLGRRLPVRLPRDRRGQRPRLPAAGRRPVLRGDPAGRPRQVPPLVREAPAPAGCAPCSRGRRLPPPSTPTPCRYWGNRLDRHVQVAPGRPYDGTARFRKVGGISTDKLDLGTGLTRSGATLGTSGVPIDPAAGRSPGSSSCRDRSTRR